MLDCDLDAVRSDLFFARTSKTRSAIVLFGTPTHREDVADIAGARDIPWVRLPTNRDALTSAIETAIAGAMSTGMWGIAAGLLVGAFGIARVPIVL